MISYNRHVHYYETDRMGVVHHSNYVRWLEEARIEFLKLVGHSYSKMESDGIISPITKVMCEYKSPVTFDDDVRVDVYVLKYTGVKLEFKYEIYNTKTNQLVLKGESSHCFIKNNEIISIKKSYPEIHNDILNEAEKDKEKLGL